MQHPSRHSQTLYPSDVHNFQANSNSQFNSDPYAESLSGANYQCPEALEFTTGDAN